MRPPVTIGVFAPNRTDECQRVLELLLASCARAGLCAYELPTADISTEAPELLLCLGGDGTMLSVAGDAMVKGIVLGGINLGHLGFLSACGRDEAELLVNALAEGAFGVEKRMALSVTLYGEGGTPLCHPLYALNEIALMRAQTGKMIDVDVELNGSLLNRYHADGVLVATPTGSTAYSLSAGGPLVWPGTGVFCLTPICPHSLTNRSVILPESLEITIRPRERRGRSEESLIFSLDGRSTHTISLGQALTIRKAPAPLRLLTLPNSDYAALLRAKLGW